MLKALYVRLLFEFDVPYEVLLRARWNQIENSRWYPWSSDERKYWWLRARRIEPWTVRIIGRLRAETSKFPMSQFLFPSPNSRTGHMRTFLNYWFSVARSRSMSRYPLKKCIRSYHRNVLLPLHMQQMAERFMIEAKLSNEPTVHNTAPAFVWLY